jgi:hypothetical protein
METKKNTIAVIVTWFGPLPPYFAAWLKSAEYNPTIDFFCFFDHEFESQSDNIHIVKTTMDREIERISKAISEKIVIKNSYKFCDLRPFFGLGYQEYIKDYSFWGYCDIDMVFGSLRDYLTEDVLSKYDRFYEYGYLSVFRNTDQMNHLYDLPGGIYSKKAIFRGKGKCTPEEQYGLYRISEKNHIKWYREKNYADFYIPYSSYILNQRENYDEQVFYWEDGKVYRAYNDKGEIKSDEMAFLHWQKRKPVIAREALDNNSYFITPSELIKKENGLPTREEIIKYNPPLSEEQKKEQDRAYRDKKMKEFRKASYSQKIIWIKQKMYFFKENKALIESKRRI